MSRAPHYQVCAALCMYGPACRGRVDYSCDQPQSNLSVQAHPQIAQLHFCAATTRSHSKPVLILLSHECCTNASLVVLFPGCLSTRLAFCPRLYLVSGSRLHRAILDLAFLALFIVEIDLDPAVRSNLSASLLMI